jgi:hypothetical protein
MRDLKIDLSKGLAFAGMCAVLCAVLFLLIRTKGSKTPVPATGPKPASP